MTKLNAGFGARVVFFTPLLSTWRQIATVGAPRARVICHGLHGTLAELTGRLLIPALVPVDVAVVALVQHLLLMMRVDLLFHIVNLRFYFNLLFFTKMNFKHIY